MRYLSSRFYHKKKKIVLLFHYVLLSYVIVHTKNKSHTVDRCLFCLVWVTTLTRADNNGI